MKNTEVNISQINAYIQGNLTVKESLFVEKMIASNELWQDVYEGLLVAQEKNINLDSIIESLQNQVLESAPVSKEVSKETSITRNLEWKRYVTMAAAFIGILIVAYTAIEFAKPPAFKMAENRSTTNNNLDENDAIQIILPSNRPILKDKTFYPSEIEQMPELADSIYFTEAENSIAEVSRLATQSASIALNDSIVLSADIINPSFIQLVPIKKNNKIGSYENLLAHYGYHQLRYNTQPSVLNSVRGASNQPEAILLPIARHAYSNINDYITNQEKNYIARFPFNGLVTIEVTVDEQGNIANYQTLASPSEEMTETSLKMLEKTPWNVPLNEANMPAKETFIVTISYGNTVYIKFIENN